jgi:outer membrane protein assembly factor BamB
MPTIRRIFVGLTLAAALSGVSVAGEWPQFQGATRDGRSTEKIAQRSWSDDGPKELWSVSVGVGFGGAAIRDGEVFLLDRRDDTEDVLRCLDFANGEQKWEVAFDAPGRLSYNGSRQVPTVGPARIYAAGPLGHVYCVDRKTKKKVWTANLAKDFGSRTPGFGFSQSPVLYGDTVLLAPLTGSVGVVAFGVADGKVRWKSKGVGGGGHSTLGMSRIGGVDQALMMTGSGLSGISAKDGALLWTHAFRNRNPIPFPTDCGDGRFFLTCGYNGGSALIQVTKQGDSFTTNELFKMRLGSQIPPAFYHDGHLYANFNENGNLRGRARPGLTCIDMKGQVKWQTKMAPDIERGGLIMVGGLLVTLGGNDGVLRLVEPSSEGYKELAAAPIFEGLRRRGNNIWAPMAFSDGKLVLRNQTVLKCLDLNAASSGAPQAPKKSAGKKKGKVF